MLASFGPQGWWPGKTRFEMMVGAVLTQNTAWTNVEKAIGALRKEKLLTPERMHAVEEGELASLIRSAGYFNIKARRLKNLTARLLENSGLDRFLRKDSSGLRGELLSINGIGPETADSIMLYAAGKSEFVVDAYTKRIFTRHGLIEENAGYEEVKALFMDNLAPDAAVFNEYHALIVRTGKDYCRTKTPLCGECPLKGFLPAGR
ncbi:MAG: endonuclease [Deltaproteobacteria bacterium RBG_19FT_COMBO_58_16]|nr:MAG: endonuclease [Deltaproteobacteria bacterium RBG_19FT_COMBO_58_16]